MQVLFHEGQLGCQLAMVDPIECYEYNEFHGILNAGYIQRAAAGWNIKCHQYQYYMSIFPPPLQVLFHEQQLDCQLTMEDPSPGMPWGRAKFQVRSPGCIGGAGSCQGPGHPGARSSRLPCRTPCAAVTPGLTPLPPEPPTPSPRPLAAAQVTAYYAPQFAELRRRCVAGGEGAYLASISRCRKWASRGGKSAAYFARTSDKRCACLNFVGSVRLEPRPRCPALSDLPATLQQALAHFSGHLST